MTNAEIVRQLEKAHEEFLSALGDIDETTSDRQPSPGDWSVGEVIHHLVLVERTIRQMCRLMRWGLMSKKLPPPLRKPAPLQVVSKRQEPMKTATQLIPLHGRPLPGLLAQLGTERQKTARFARRVDLGKLRARFVRHPYVGIMSGEEWISFLAYHQQRHEKQIKEILHRLRRQKSSKK